MGVRGGRDGGCVLGVGGGGVKVKKKGNADFKIKKNITTQKTQKT